MGDGGMGIKSRSAITTNETINRYEKIIFSMV
jgi:hypothetical protein